MVSPPATPKVTAVPVKPLPGATPIKTGAIPVKSNATVVASIKPVVSGAIPTTTFKAPDNMVCTLKKDQDKTPSKPDVVTTSKPVDQDIKKPRIMYTKKHSPTQQTVTTLKKPDAKPVASTPASTFGQGAKSKVEIP